MGMKVKRRKRKQVALFDDDNEFDGKDYFYKCFDISNSDFITYVRLFNVRCNDAGSKSGDVKYFVFDNRIKTFDADLIHFQPDVLLDVVFNNVKSELITNKAEKAKLMLIGL